MYKRETRVSILSPLRLSRNRRIASSVLKIPRTTQTLGIHPLLLSLNSVLLSRSVVPGVVLESPLPTNLSHNNSPRLFSHSPRLGDLPSSNLTLLMAEEPSLGSKGRVIARSEDMRSHGSQGLIKQEQRGWDLVVLLRRILSFIVSTQTETVLIQSL